MPMKTERVETMRTWEEWMSVPRENRDQIWQLVKRFAQPYRDEWTRQCEIAWDTPPDAPYEERSRVAQDTLETSNRYLEMTAWAWRVVRPLWMLTHFFVTVEGEKRC